jgi:uncharacterized membrane protein SpoIIM required for sporulation
MLEFLMNPKKAERRPWEMTIIGFFYTAVAILVSIFLFHNSIALEKYNSIFIVTFTTILSIPFMYYIVKLEEKKEKKIKEETKLIKEHGRAVSALMFLFIGYILAFSLAYIALPQDIRDSGFQAQLESYCVINRGDIRNCSNINGLSVTGRDVGLSLRGVSAILSNNFFVMITVLLFSFLFGGGAIFILAWNASVIGTAIGLFSKGAIENIPLSFLRYLVHGLPEIAAYFVAALAGGIISVAVIKHDFGKKEFWHVMQDSLDLIILALIILVVAAFMEVFLTPSIMSIF